MNYKKIVFMAIIGSYIFNIDSHDSKTNITDFDPSVHCGKVQLMLENDFKKFGLKSKEEVPLLLEWTIDDFMKYQNSFKKVLLKNNEIVGYINYKQFQDEPSWWVISEIVVDKQHQKKGYGEELMQSSFDDIINKHGTTVCMIVLKSNKQARNFYEKKLGFEIDPRLISGDHEDFVALSLKIKQ